MAVATTDLDVLIVGAGISGIGIAHHLKTKRPGTNFAILEGRDQIGGTWSLFKYPGIRSDSDMPTFGYAFKPWTHKSALADAHVIRDYLGRTVSEGGIDSHIRFNHKVLAADFDSETNRWAVTAEVDGETVMFTSRFLFLGTGYYDYAGGYTPDFEGAADFGGRIIHPQQWPEDLDYAGKRVVVIGSGATAVTLVPSMADEVEHITMLQRSPSYVVSIPREDGLSNKLIQVFGPERGHRLVRRKNVFVARSLYRLCMKYPAGMRRLLIAGVRRQLPEHYDVDTHFTPNYNPWEERLCMVPDGDLFRAIRKGKADVVTDHIERFTENGIALKSGQHLDADIIVTATGLNLLAFGRIALSVDGDAVNLPDLVAYKAMMMSGLPNFAYAIGYTNISWTLKVDLVGAHFCRVLDHMDEHGYERFEPVAEEGMETAPLLNFQAGYVQRSIHAFPRAGTAGPWTIAMAYEDDQERLLKAPIDDASMVFTTARELATV